MIIASRNQITLVKRTSNGGFSWLVWPLISIPCILGLLFLFIKLANRQQGIVIAEQSEKKDKETNKGHPPIAPPPRYNTIDLPDEPAPAYIP